MQVAAYATFTTCAVADGMVSVPTILRCHGFKLFFYSNEGSPREPVHVHVEKGDCEAKLWVEPAIAVAYNDGFTARQLRELLELVKSNEGRITRVWHEYFG